jgi:hypothetical protein
MQLSSAFFNAIFAVQSLLYDLRMKPLLAIFVVEYSLRNLSMHFLHVFRCASFVMQSLCAICVRKSSLWNLPCALSGMQPEFH